MLWGLRGRVWSHGSARVRLVDLSAFGRPTRLAWSKRRWRCADGECKVVTFTDQEPRIAPPGGAGRQPRCAARDPPSGHRAACQRDRGGAGLRLARGDESGASVGPRPARQGDRFGPGRDRDVPMRPVPPSALGHHRRGVPAAASYSTSWRAAAPRGTRWIRARPSRWHQRVQ